MDPSILDILLDITMANTAIIITRNNMLWQVQLQSHALVDHVWVTMSPGAYQKFAIFVVEMLDGTNTARYKPCAQFEVGIGRRRGHVTHSSQSQGRFHEQLVRFSCNEGAGQLGQFVYIRDDRVDRWAASTFIILIVADL